MSYPNAAKTSLFTQFPLESTQASCTRVGGASVSDGAPLTFLHTPSEGHFCSSAFQEPLSSLSQHGGALGFLRLPCSPSASAQEREQTSVTLQAPSTSLNISFSCVSSKMTQPVVCFILYFLSWFVILLTLLHAQEVHRRPEIQPT